MKDRHNMSMKQEYKDMKDTHKMSMKQEYKEAGVALSEFAILNNLLRPQAEKTS